MHRDLLPACHIRPGGNQSVKILYLSRNTPLPRRHLPGAALCCFGRPMSSFQPGPRGDSLCHASVTCRPAKSCHYVNRPCNGWVHITGGGRASWKLVLFRKLWKLSTAMRRRGSRNHCYTVLVKLPFIAMDKGSSDLVQIFQPALAFHCIEPLSHFHARDDYYIIAYVQRWSGTAFPRGRAHNKSRVCDTYACFNIVLEEKLNFQSLSVIWGIGLMADLYLTLYQKINERSLQNMSAKS